LYAQFSEIAHARCENNPRVIVNIVVAISMKKEDHVLTRTHGNRSNAQSNLKPRSELAADIHDVRRIYQGKGSYTPGIRKSLEGIIKKNEKEFPHLFGKDAKK
jgi:hypothetical protein